MNQETITKLLSINHQFYQTFAADFDATRQRLQPGVERVLDLIPSNARILDLGCGNGELARELARREFAGDYVGVDFSEGLVARCQVSGVEVSGEEVSGEEVSGGRYQFRVADLTASDWEAGMEGTFDVVVAFAVFHHLPGPFHLEIVRKVRRLLSLQHPERSDALGAQSKDAGTNRYHDSPHPSTTAVSFPKPKETASAQDAEVSTLSPSIPTVPTNSHNFPFPKPKETPCAQDADVSASIPSIPTVPTNSHNFPFPKPEETPSAQDADVSPSLLISSSPLPLSPPLFILSNWQFLNSPRWVARIQLWERVGLTTEDVAPNDYLLDWRRGGEGLRYVHHFSEDELAKLAQDTGFEVTETFHSDGAEGNLGLYQIWRPI